MPNPLTILVVHNHYQQRGGEDSVFETECSMLEAAGHVVIRYEKHNDEIGNQRLAASGQRLEAPTAQVLGTRYQVLANTRFPKKDNPQALAPSPYHLAPSSTPTHPHTHTLSPENFSQSCQSCNPVKKTFRAFLCFSWLKKLLASFVSFVSFVVNKASRRTKTLANHPGSGAEPQHQLLSTHYSLLTKFQLFARTIWNFQVYREITEVIKRCKPDVVHCHNTFPLISPSVYWAAAKQGIPVVQTLHNYRLICINPYLYRNGRICEDCLGHSPLRGVIHRCYRNSFSASFTVAAMLMIHRLLGTYRNKVTTYIALTEFGRRKFLEGRLCDPARVVVKPNAVAAEAATAEGSGFRVQGKESLSRALSDQEQGLAAEEATSPKKPRSSTPLTSPTEGSPCQTDTLNPEPSPLTPEHGCGYPATVLYVGRLSPEKGVDILIAAWKLFLEQRSTASGQRLVTGEATSPTKPTSSTPPASRAVGNSCQTPTPPHTQTPAPPHSHTHTLFPLNPEPSPPPPAAVRLVIIGDGPERAALEAIAKELPSVTFTGRLSSIDLHAHMARASILVLPSRCYETFAMAVNEAASLGTAAIVSDIGGQASLVEDGVTGYTFRSGSAESLAETLAKALADPDRLAEMGRHAQARFLAGDCPPQRNVAALCLTYAHVCSPSEHTQENTSVRALGARTRHTQVKP